VATDVSEIKRLQDELLEKEKLAIFTQTAIAVNHEINNPLAPILGNAQLLLRDEEKFDAVSLKRIRSIERNAQRIYAITQKLREIQKPVAKKYVGRTEMLDIHDSK
jgi:C4-dicarboxylate-specific signal transduction histidine kinase